jgi:hypothetical protein
MMPERRLRISANEESMKHLEVVAAIILYDMKVLCVQRGQHKFEYISQKYEFSGDKVEPNETNDLPTNGATNSEDEGPD